MGEGLVLGGKARREGKNRVTTRKWRRCKGGSGSFLVLCERKWGILATFLILCEKEVGFSCQKTVIRAQFIGAWNVSRQGCAAGETKNLRWIWQPFLPKL